MSSVVQGILNIGSFMESGIIQDDNGGGAPPSGASGPRRVTVDGSGFRADATPKVTPPVRQEPRTETLP